MHNAVQPIETFSVRLISFKPSKKHVKIKMIQDSMVFFVDVNALKDQGYQMSPQNERTLI